VMRVLLAAGPAGIVHKQPNHFLNLWVEVGPVFQLHRIHAGELPAEDHEGGGRAHAKGSHGEIAGLPSDPVRVRIAALKSNLRSANSPFVSEVLRLRKYRPNLNVVWQGPISGIPASKNDVGDFL